jgi:hypothetical protein
VPAEPTQPRPARTAPRIDAPVVLDKLPCCWPIGQPRTPSFRFCEKPNLAGRPYCPEHCRLAYEKPPATQDASNKRLDRAANKLAAFIRSQEYAQ